MIEFRKLKLRDLNAIEEIERDSYPTPWSRSMFAGELAKPSSICLGAVDGASDELVGYLIISRYVDAWHVMNIAAALVSRNGAILANVVSSQAELHAQYGGVVPEVASRRHLELVTPVIREALHQGGAQLEHVQRIAVTQGPGLIGALLVGLSAAK